MPELMGLLPQDLDSAEVAALLRIATTELYGGNAFRLAELPVDAPASEVIRRTKRIEHAGDFGAPIEPGPVRLLPLAPSGNGDVRRYAEVVQDALEELADPAERLAQELMWFWPLQPGDARGDAGLAALGRGDVEASITTWRQQAADGVGQHNLAILTHAAALDASEPAALESLARQAIGLWLAVVQDATFWSRVRARIEEINDRRLPVGAAQRVRAALPVAVLASFGHRALEFGARQEYATAQRLGQLIWQSGYEAAAIQEAARRAAEPLRTRLEQRLAMSTEELDRLRQGGGPASAQVDRVAEQLITEAVPLLASIDCLLPVGHPIRDVLHDQVARLAYQAAMAHWNATHDPQRALELREALRPIAADAELQATLDSELAVVRGMLVGSTCWFCGSRPGDEAMPVDVAPLKSGRLPSGTTVEAHRVPRCASCAASHRRAETWSKWALALGCACGIIGAITLPDSALQLDLPGIIILALLAGAGWWSGAYIKDQPLDGSKPLSAWRTSPGLAEYRARPDIKQWLGQGYTLQPLPKRP